MISGRTSVIKSIQRGVLSVAGDGTDTATDTATITAVDTSKTMLNMLGFHVPSGVPAGMLDCSIVLTNATTITGTVGQTSGTVTISYEVIEFY